MQWIKFKRLNNLSGNQIPHSAFPNLPPWSQATGGTARTCFCWFSAMASLRAEQQAVFGTGALEFSFVSRLLLRVPFESAKCQQPWRLFESPDMIQEAMSPGLPNGTHYCQFLYPKGGVEGNVSRWSPSSDSQKLSPDPQLS